MQRGSLKMKYMKKSSSKKGKTMSYRRARLWIFSFLVFLVTPVLVNANADVPIKVKKVTGNLKLNNTITVEVENLTEYLEQPGKDSKKFVLYLKWRPLDGVNSSIIDATDELEFYIERTSDSKDVWNALLSPYGKGLTYKVPVSIGYENENPIPSDVLKYPLIVMSWFWLICFGIFFALALILSVWLLRKSNIIRNLCPNINETIKKPYSLGRTQMFAWTFLIVVSYVFIWMVTGDRESLSASALVLMGISSATALGAGIVDFSNRMAKKSKHHDLEKEKKVLDSVLNELNSQITATHVPTNLSELKKEEAEKKALLENVNKEIDGLNSELQCKETEYFWKDILSDVYGISLHRFQIALWTIVLMIIWVVSIYKSLAMPEFSGTLLTLMGISGGTYIGFKFPEKK
jgi:hypothetical protein